MKILNGKADSEFLASIRQAVRNGTLSDQDRAVKYLEAVAKGNKRVADAYYGGGFTGVSRLSDDVIEKAIFYVSDVEQGGKGRLFFSKLEDAILGTAEIAQDEAGRAIYGGTKLQLSRDQLVSLSSTNKEINVAYRNSRLLNIQDASIVMKEDEVFINRMREIFSDEDLMRRLQIDNLTGTGQFANYAEVVSAFGGDQQGNIRAAFYLAQQTIKRGEDDETYRDIGNKILVQFSEMKQRLETIASAQGDPAMLGNYINTLSATASTSKQLEHIMLSVGNQVGEGPGMLTQVQADKIRHALFNPYLVHNPEGAIDFAIGGGGTVNFVQTAQDLIDSIKGFSGYDFIDEQESAIKALWQLTGNLESVKDISQVQYPLTFEQFREAIINGAAFDSKGVLIATEQDALSNVQVLLERVRRNAIVQQGETIGRARALYHAGILGEDPMLKLSMDSFIGLTRMGSDEMQIMLEGAVKRSRKNGRRDDGGGNRYYWHGRKRC